MGSYILTAQDWRDYICVAGHTKKIFFLLLLYRASSKVKVFGGISFGTVSVCLLYWDQTSIT